MSESLPQSKWISSDLGWGSSGVPFRSVEKQLCASGPSVLFLHTGSDAPYKTWSTYTLQMRKPRN